MKRKFTHLQSSISNRPEEKKLDTEFYDMLNHFNEEYNPKLEKATRNVLDFANNHYTLELRDLGIIECYKN